MVKGGLQDSQDSICRVLRSTARIRVVRIVPHKAADGAVDGFRVSGIRRGSLLDSCGVRNGDIVQKADGMPLLTVEALTAAFAATQERQSFTISLVRRGVPVELRLRWPS